MTEARIGVDVGGTFTDAVTLRDGEITVSKSPSTPEAPHEGVANAVREGLGPDDDVAALSHASTVATNAVLEKELATTALVTNQGFRDALEIARQDRPSIYDLHAEKPSPVVGRDHRYEVPGRVDERGNVTEPLDEDQVEAVARELPSDVEAVAVSMLFSYENPDHERRVREVLRDETPAEVSVSSDVHPEIREYERTLVTCIDAGLKPVVRSYLRELTASLEELGLTCDVRVMQSNGGVASVEAAAERPVRTLLSGPAAGVQGAAYVAGLRGTHDVITMDMGGTSCDVSLVRDGEPRVTTDLRIGGLPVAVPMVDVHTIGSGGGSIAWIDDGGALRVGPRSAGAEPGPVCYGRGGTQPTVTDAHHVLGRIEPSFVDDPLPRDEVMDRFADLADHLDTDVRDAAHGVLEVADSNMLRALRLVSVERGHDPRDFSLVAYGGAGPLHAPRLAMELGSPRVVVPRAAGVLSALGLQCTDAVHSYSTSMVRGWNEVDADEVREVFRGFRREGEEQLTKEGFSEDDMSFRRYLDMRYVGQSHEISVPVDDPGSVERGFHDLHRERYGHAYTDEDVELVTVRLDAVGRNPPPDLGYGREGSVDDAVVRDRPVVFDDGTRSTPVYERERLPVDGEFRGPAIVEGGGTTVAVPPGQRAEIDEYGNLVVYVGGR